MAITLKRLEMESLNNLKSNKMKHLRIFFILILLTSCSVEQRIREYSYTKEWYYINAKRFQVYQTARGTRYIIVLNKKETKFKRQYLKR